MRIPRSTCYLLALFCGFAGCAQTGAARSNPASNVRTVASVGDKPLPIVAGEPGSSLRAETEELDLPESAGSRISGRVYDERGKPLPNARVRLAVDSAAGGRVVSATTDRSGAFTLRGRGLRPGSSYTLIAEYEGRTGLMTGRTKVKVPQSDVRISLQARAEQSDPDRASIRPARPRVEPISNVDAEDAEEFHESGVAGQSNSEDIEPPTSEAVSLFPKTGRSGAWVPADDSLAPVRAGWNLRQNLSENDRSTAVKPQSRRDDVNSASRSRASDEPSSDFEDDGPNPLPPALESDAVSALHPGELPGDDPIKLARRAPRPMRAGNAARLNRDRPNRIDVWERSAGQEPRLIPEDVLPGERVIAPHSYAPVAVGEPADARSTASRSPKRREGAATAPSSEPPSANSTGDADPSEATTRSEATDPSNASDSTRSPARPTWREVSENQSQVPLDESVHRTANDDRVNDPPVITLASTGRGSKSVTSRLFAAFRPPVDPAVNRTVCRIDPNERRLVDFQLPGVDGRMVSLHDIHADVILLDFWGSWCAPCKKSIPHLVELQARFGPKRFQVVGIACERGSSSQDRCASAAKTAQELGINYPVLVSPMDGSCAVQQGLQVQFYPTMVLLDRDGRLLAREQGATDITLARMDRAIASALRGHGDNSND
jgi:thiol-disulfide isomerase/thioredoxin